LASTFINRLLPRDRLVSRSRSLCRLSLGDQTNDGVILMIIQLRRAK
jgi:hypothetical protein